MKCTPDYVFEARFAAKLRKAQLFDWLMERVEYLEAKSPNNSTLVFSSEDENYTLYDFCDNEIRQDPDFQWLKD